MFCDRQKGLVNATVSDAVESCWFVIEKSGYGFRKCGIMEERLSDYKDASFRHLYNMENSVSKRQGHE